MEVGPEWHDLDATQRAFTSNLAARSREKLRRVLQARQLVRRMARQTVPRSSTPSTRLGYTITRWHSKWRSCSGISDQAT
jgi:hypothetical protein